jgi:hypothetical protein
MQVKQVFSAHGRNGNTRLGQFKFCACDDLETLEWVPLAEPLPEVAFEADEQIIEGYRQTKFESGLPVDADLACGGNQ